MQKVIFKRLFNCCTSMMCMIIGRKTYVKIELEQTKAKYKEKMAVFAL